MFTYERHIPSRAEIVVGRVAEAIRRWCDRCELAEFAQSSPDEVHRVARDLNMDAVTLMQVASLGPPSLLNRRLKVLGIDPQQLRRHEPAAAQDLARCCALCARKTQCASDLSSKPGSSDWKNYCPNEHTLAALTSPQGDTAKGH
jgi:hypothetical protein